MGFSLPAALSHAGHLLSPNAVPAARIALERDAGERRRRLATSLRDSVSQRRHPTRPKMRALVVGPGRRLSWRAVAAPPPPPPLGATVRPLAIATCDMDRPIGLGRTPFPLPLQFGHECVAEILTVGADVRDFVAGQKVVVPFQISCGRCHACSGGRTGNCTGVPPISMYGFGLAGGHWGGVIADEVAVPFADAMLVGLPDSIEPEAAASVGDNVSDAYRHVGPYLPELIESGRGGEVLIIGSVKRRHPFTASVSLYAGLIAKALGAGSVTLADARPDVRRQASELDLTATDPSELRGPPTAPLVVDASAHPRGLRLALQRTAPDGVCSSVGSLHANARLPFSTMYGRNVTLHVKRAHARPLIPQVLELMAAGSLRPELVTTLTAPIDQATEALDEHLRGRSTKTILTAP
jgi:alcohol dehydrogenase